ncbi:UNVERIFIED_CONTAM: hypothetical protein Sangu_1722400 [Sesamum angustifolium]|uniref:Zinc knuckle CX2CX4HX4C domain-containing protein n=1 Tax=Sesamum angustifolium TaxID=2727405 RepID=A0AAW2MJU8_9LAMI
MTQPLIRALHVCTTMREEMVVSFTYERLQNFCYLYGQLGHIHNYCELKFEEGFTDLGEPMLYRAWLRVLPVNWSSHITGKSSDPPTDRWRQPDTPQEPEVFGMFGDKGKQALQGKEPWSYRSGDGNSTEELQSAQLKSSVCPPCSGCYNTRLGTEMGGQARPILRKRGREPAILEGGVELIRDEKRRHLLNEESNVSSDGCSGCHEIPFVELPGVGLPLDSSCAEQAYSTS